MKVKAKTNNERQAAFRDRMREAGYVQVTVWILQADILRHAKYVDRLRKK